MKHKPLVQILAVLVSILIASFITACSKEAESTPPQSSDQAAPEGMRIVSYTVRGEVRSLPDESNDLMVRHEAIPEFRQGNGTLGMNVMVMPFPFADGINADGMSIGDIVAITFEVTHREDWSLVGYQTVGWELLPADTELNFTPIETGVDRFDPETGEPISPATNE